LTVSLKREVLWLLVAVLAVDALFVSAYFVGRVRGASDPIKVAFTALWTLVTLGVVIRGLSRIRKARLDSSVTSRS
jgi:RsiW-degrading membrane proteinase PrsW (M82 family)